MNRLIVEMIANDIQPFSMVEDIVFRNVISYACPNYEMPHRTYFNEKEMPKLYAEVVNNLKRKLNTNNDNSATMSITTDVWTEKHTRRAFLGITCHWIDENFNRQWAVLSQLHITGSHTGNMIVELCKNVLSEFGILEKIDCVVRDGGTKVVAGFHNAAMPSIRVRLSPLRNLI